MRTSSKLKYYETALIVWQIRMKHWRQLMPGEIPPAEPGTAQFGLTEALEVWAAAKVRSKVTDPRIP